MLTIVAGTARCGSTMLSRMLSLHPDVLSLSAFWNCFTDTEGSVPTREMSGAEFWRHLTEPAASFDGLVQAGVQKNDLAPYQTRYDYASGVPPICRVLEAINGESPDPIYDALAPEVPSWPRRPVAEHCHALFDSLAARLGRRVIVERTGGSVGYLDLLREMFPGARFVFLHRDGLDTALSMSRHPEMRLAALRIIAEAIGGSAPEILEMFPPEIRAAAPADFTGLTEPPFDSDRFMSFPIPLTFFGGFWSSLTRTGTREIRKVRPDRWTTLRYEALLENTRAELTRLAGFIGARADRQWLDGCCAFVDAGRMGSAAAQLHPIDLAALRRACAAGTRAFDLLESERREADRTKEAPA